jgi:chorismate synthase
MVEKIGDISAKIDYQIDPDLLKDKVEENSDAFMTPDFDVCEPWRDLIDKSRDKNESLGGTAAVIFWGLPVGLGSHTQHDLRLDSILAARIMSIPAVRAVECGNAVEYCSKPGMYADALKYDEDRGFYRPTNRAAGIEGGMTNGQPLIIRFHMKPLPGGGKVESVDLQTLKSALPAGYRSDVQALQAAAVIAESLLAIELASQLLVSYGGANVEQIQNRLRSVY